MGFKLFKKADQHGKGHMRDRTFYFRAPEKAPLSLTNEMKGCWEFVHDLITHREGDSSQGGNVLQKFQDAILIHEKQRVAAVATFKVLDINNNRKLSKDEFLEILSGKDGGETDAARKAVTKIFKKVRSCLAKEITWKQFQLAYQRFDKILRESIMKINHNKMLREDGVDQFGENLYLRQLAKKNLRPRSISEITDLDGSGSEDYDDGAVAMHNDIVLITAGGPEKEDLPPPYETSSATSDHLEPMAMFPGGAMNFDLETPLADGGRGSVYSKSELSVVGEKWEDAGASPESNESEPSLAEEPTGFWYWKPEYLDQKFNGPVTATIMKRLINEHGSNNIWIWKGGFSQWVQASSINLTLWGLGERRRMAQREFSKRRDSPVMTRLLEEIIAAQDK